MPPWNLIRSWVLRLAWWLWRGISACVGMETVHVYAVRIRVSVQDVDVSQRCYDRRRAELASLIERGDLAGGPGETS